MPWSRTKPTNPRYRTAEYRITRKRLKAKLERDGSAQCAEVICVMRSRLIVPGMDWHVCHDSTGTQVRGICHRSCNIKEAARRARAKQSQPVRYSRIW
jgi:hypothetical protein